MEGLGVWKDRYRAWLMDRALPLWSDAGIDRAAGGFQELLGLDGAPVAAPRRARVQGRQSFVFSLAGRMGWAGPWERAARLGLSYMDKIYRRPDGLYSTLAGADGAMLDARAMTYDQAFVLLAQAALFDRTKEQGLSAAALALKDAIVSARTHPGGGFREEGEKAYLSNPHMHLLEAALAWMDVGGGPAWRALAQPIVDLALTRFIDPRLGVLREFFDADWAPLAGDPGRVVEPGHQFEWAWLLMRWWRLTGDEKARRAAETLFAAGTRGVDPARQAAMDETDETCAPRRAGARLWPQTERLKAAMILFAEAEGDARALYEGEANAAAGCLWRYLDGFHPGLWRDKMQPDGGFVEEPAPASSLYHIICAVNSLQEF